MKTELLILSILLLCVSPIFGVKMQNPAQLLNSPITNFQKSQLKDNRETSGDWNGNIFDADTSFEIIDQPLTTVETVDGLLVKVASKALEKQNEAMKDYLQQGDGSLMEISEPSAPTTANNKKFTNTSFVEVTMIQEPSQNALKIEEIREEAVETQTRVASLEPLRSSNILAHDQEILKKKEELPEQLEVSSPPTKAENPTFNLKGAANLADINENKLTTNNLPGTSLKDFDFDTSNLENLDTKMSLTPITLDNVPALNVLTSQDYEIEEVYWKNRHTRVKVVRPVTRPLSDPVSILFFMLLAFLMIGTIILVRETINRWMQKNFGASLDAILKDIITLYLIITILRILDYFDIFLDLEYYVNMRLVSVIFLVFSIFWLILGVYSVLRCHGFVKSWNNLEKDFPKRDQIFRQYENLYLEPSKTKKQIKEMEEKRQQLEYFLIRQEFVFPTFLPILGEAFLRDDFNFATYMAKSLARASDSMFKYSFISLLTIIIIGAFWLFFAGLSGMTQVFVLGALPIVIFLMFLAMNIKLTRIYKKLVQIVDSPYDVNFTKFDNLRQPLINLDKLKVPEYLSESDTQPAGSKVFSSFRMPNRHERLFWLASPRFMVRLMHIILILQIIWVAVLALAFGGSLDDYRQIILVVVGAILTLINLLYFIPANLKTFCLTTSIQMLKDRKLVAEVIDENKRRNAELFMKLFRLLKSRSREQRFRETRPANLREVIIDQVRNYFQSIPKEENDKISIVYLKDLAHYCGADLSDEEIVYLSRASKDTDNKVSFQKFMEAIEEFVDDVKQDKFRLIRDTLRSIINRDDGMVSLRELRDAISESQILPQEEIDAMMHEIRYLPFRNAEISIDLVARFIRDSIEGMPV